MPNKKNKVKFNICNVHYALITVDDDGEVTFGTPVAMPGAVSLSLEPNGEPSNFYADGYAYYTISNNMGYEGDLELAMVPESFRTDVLKESLDTNQVLVENANVETANFALLFEFDGDIKKIRHVLYNCSAARPNIESTTMRRRSRYNSEIARHHSRTIGKRLCKGKDGRFYHGYSLQPVGILPYICRRPPNRLIRKHSRRHRQRQRCQLLPEQQGRRKTFLLLKQRRRRENP